MVSYSHVADDESNSQVRHADIGIESLPKYTAGEKIIFGSTGSVDPKQACAVKKMTFGTIPITLKVICSGAAQSGADKYGWWNWLDLGDGSMSLMTYLEALDRHLLLFRAGQDRTSDTDIHNLDSMICGLAVIRDAMIFGKVNDDRVKLSEEQIKILESLINKEIKP